MPLVEQTSRRSLEWTSFVKNVFATPLLAQSNLIRAWNIQEQQEFEACFRAYVGRSVAREQHELEQQRSRYLASEQAAPPVGSTTPGNNNHNNTGNNNRNNTGDNSHNNISNNSGNSLSNTTNNNTRQQQQQQKTVPVTAMATILVTIIIPMTTTMATTILVTTTAILVVAKRLSTSITKKILTSRLLCRNF